MKLPMIGYVLAIKDQDGKTFGLYPLTECSPEIFPSKKKAMLNKLFHQDIVKVMLTAVK